MWNKGNNLNTGAFEAKYTNMKKDLLNIIERRGGLLYAWLCLFNAENVILDYNKAILIGHVFPL